MTDIIPLWMKLLCWHSRASYVASKAVWGDACSFQDWSLSGKPSVELVQRGTLVLRWVGTFSCCEPVLSAIHHSTPIGSLCCISFDLDNYVIPLAKKLETCGVFGVSRYVEETEWYREIHFSSLLTPASLAGSNFIKKWRVSHIRYRE